MKTQSLTKNLNEIRFTNNEKGEILLQIRRNLIAENEKMECDFKELSNGVVDSEDKDRNEYLIKQKKAFIESNTDVVRGVIFNLDAELLRLNKLNVENELNKEAPVEKNETIDPILVEDVEIVENDVLQEQEDLLEKIAILKEEAEIIENLSAVKLKESELKAQQYLEELGIEERTSFREEYQKRLLAADYFSAFKLLTLRINAIPDDEDKQELEDFFFNYQEVLKVAAQKEIVHKYALHLVDFIQDVTLTDENKQYMMYLFPIGAISLCFSTLVSTGAFSKAAILEPHINKNLNSYPNLLKDLIVQNKVNALDYLLSVTSNLNFNNNEIMNLLMGLSSYEQIYEFFEKYNLSINAKLAVSHHNPAISAPEWNTLFGRIVDSRNYELFDKILSSSKQKPNLSVIIRREFVVKTYSIFYLIRKDNDLNRYITRALEYPQITNQELNGILALLMQNPQILISNIDNGVVDKIFSHPNLSSVSFVEDSEHLFGYLSCVDYWLKKISNDSIVDALRYVLDRFLSRFPDVQTIPVGTSLNMYGTTVYQMINTSDSRVFKLLLPILSHYRAWVNVENPCGKTPLELTDKASNPKVREYLLKLGAVERRRSLMGRMKFWAKQNIPNIDFSPRTSLDENVSGSTVSLNGYENDKGSFEGSGDDVAQEMRESFNRVRPTLKKVPLEVKLACEEMFLNAENLLTLTDKAEKGKFNEDVFFLVQTFNDYLPSVLNTYVGTLDLEFIKNSPEATNESKENVLKQINMLNAHIRKLRENIELKMKKLLDMDIQRNGEFLKERLGISDDKIPNEINEIERIIKDNEKS